MTMNLTNQRDKGFLIWANTHKNYMYMKNQNLNICNLYSKWERLNQKRKDKWNNESNNISTFWIKDNCIKRCGNCYNWQDISVIVAKCEYDGQWYMATDNYMKSTLINDMWPTVNNIECSQNIVSLKIDWTNGLHLSFKTR